jgi:hypothetical protein
MTTYIPDYLIRGQMAVGTLVAFGLIRIIVASLAHERGWAIAVIERLFVLAALVYCLPQLATLLSAGAPAYVATAELEGKVIGCAIALFCAPILSHRIGFE